MTHDVHAHLFLDAFDEDREDVIRRARKHRVTPVVNNGLDTTTNEAAIDLARNHDICEAACGLYPGRLSGNDELQTVIDQVRRADVIAVGEVGLDYGYAEDERDREVQRNVFTTLIRVAKEEKKPLIVHSRNAEDDVLSVLAEENPYQVVLHAFTGSRTQWQEATRRGYYLSIPPVCERSVQFQEMIDDTPSHQLLIETDSPYLAATRGERNEPCNATVSKRVIEDRHGIRDADDILQDTYNRVFGSSSS